MGYDKTKREELYCDKEHNSYPNLVPFGGKKMSDLNGKIAIVTGANSGMGVAAVEALSDMGATVLMLCRNEKRGRDAIDSLTAEKERKLDLIICDLGDFTSIRNAARYIRKNYPRVDILVNNAGFISLDRQETKEGVERQFGINHLGHFLLTTQLLDLMIPGSRIVNVASGAHKVGRIHFEDINLQKGCTNLVKSW